MKVAIQGVKGSFHHMVAVGYFGNDTTLAECMSFGEMPTLVTEEKVDAAVMAIENSIAGAILPNYALIEESGLHIVGEVHLPIHQNLMGLKGQTIADIKEVYSHPMALLQCRQFFKQYPHIKLIEDKDTAEVAQRIQAKQLQGVGAIAGVLAAELYDLEIIAPEIQTIKENATRFVILKKQPLEKTEVLNKASIKFGIVDRKGCLGEVLSEFSKNEVNLIKIQSLPVIEKPWEYVFFVDLVFDNYKDYKKSLQDIESKVKECKILGEYKQNK